MRIALVGCGQISRSHIAALRAVPGATIVAVCDQDPWKARDTSSFVPGTASYSTVATMLEESRPEVVHVLTPPNTHADIAVEAMKSGCHVLVEKPMAVTVEEADRIIAAAREHNVRVCTNHNYLFKPSVARARQMVASGAIGEVVYVDSYYGLAGEGNSYSGSAGRYHWAHRLPGGAFTNFLPHLIYLQMAFLGGPVSVAGVAVSSPTRSTGGPTEMAVTLQGGTACGVMAISMNTRPYAKFVDIYGTKGVIHADLVRELCVVHHDRRMPRMLSKALFSLEDSVQLGSQTTVNSVRVALGKMGSMPELPVLLKHFYSWIQGGPEPPISADYGRNMVELLEEIRGKSETRIAFAPAPTRMESPEAPGAALTTTERAVAQQGFSGKVLVTGATGLLGHRLVSALSRCGASVVALVRDRSRVSPELERQAEIVCGDMRDRAAIAAAMRDVSVVYNCAAVTTNRSPWKNHYETNVLGTQTVLEEAWKAGVQRVVHISSVIVYGLGKQPGNRRVLESDGYSNRIDRWDHYMRSKIEADRRALEFGRRTGLSVTVLRLGILYGPGGGTSAAKGLTQLGPLRFVIGSGSNRLPFTFVDNAVDCLLLSAITPAATGNAFNLVDEPQIRMRDFLGKVTEATGERCLLVPAPSAPLVAAGKALEWRSYLVKAQSAPRLSSFVVRSACRDLQYDTEKARTLLGWRAPYSTEEGIRKTFCAS